jgi:predicted acetyltransferase
VQLSRLPRSQQRLALVPIEPADADAVEEAYRRFAQARPGYLDRGPYVWGRVRDSTDQAVRGVMVRGPDGVEGYLYARSTKKSHPSPLHDLSLTDFVATTGRASACLVDYLATHRSTADVATWHGSAIDPVVWFLGEGYSVRIDEHWMQRVVHVGEALSTRGYPAVSAKLSLQVDDPLLPENDGVYRLDVDGGQASVEHTTGKGTVKLGARALGPLFSGYGSATQLASAGLLQGDTSSIRTLDLLFAGPTPGIADYF